MTSYYAEQKRKERNQARIGLASNIVGLGAGAAALVQAAKEPDLKTPVGGVITTPARIVSRRSKYIAGGLVGLQALNTGGDVVSNLVLRREATKKVPTSKAMSDKQRNAAWGAGATGAVAVPAGMYLGRQWDDVAAYNRDMADTIRVHSNPPKPRRTPNPAAQGAVVDLDEYKRFRTSAQRARMASPSGAAQAARSRGAKIGAAVGRHKGKLIGAAFGTGLAGLTYADTMAKSASPIEFHHATVGKSLNSDEVEKRRRESEGNPTAARNVLGAVFPGIHGLVAGREGRRLAAAGTELGGGLAGGLIAGPAGSLVGAGGMTHVANRAGFYTRETKKPRKKKIEKANRAYFDPETDRQRRQGLLAGAATGGAIVAGDHARQTLEVTRDKGTKQVSGIKFKDGMTGKGGKLVPVAAGLGLLGATAYTTGRSRRNRPWN